MFHNKKVPSTPPQLQSEMKQNGNSFLKGTLKHAPSTAAIYQIIKTRDNWIWKILNTEN